jgi:hypothetical protein
LQNFHVASLDLNFCTNKLAQELKKSNAKNNSICCSGNNKYCKNKWNLSVDIHSVITILQDQSFYILFDNIDIDNYGLKYATEINKNIAKMPCATDRTYIFVNQETKNNNNDFNYQLKFYDITFQSFELLEKINNKKFNSKEHKWYLDEKGLSEFKYQLTQHPQANLVVNYSLLKSNDNNTADFDKKKPLYGVISTTTRVSDLLTIGSLDLNFCSPKISQEFIKFKSIHQKYSVVESTKNIWSFSLIDIHLIINILQDNDYFILFSNIDVEQIDLEYSGRSNELLATLSKPTKCYIFVTQIQTNDSVNLSLFEFYI